MYSSFQLRWRSIARISPWQAFIGKRMHAVILQCSGSRRGLRAQSAFQNKKFWRSQSRWTTNRSCFPCVVRLSTRFTSEFNELLLYLPPDSPPPSPPPMPPSTECSEDDSPDRAPRRARSRELTPVPPPTAAPRHSSTACRSGLTCPNSGIVGPTGKPYHCPNNQHSWRTSQ